MKKYLFILIALLVSSCAPRVVPAAEPVFYQGLKDDIFAAVVQSISTAPGLNDSNGWIISQSDAAGGFVRADTTTNALWVGPVTHTRSVVITQVDDSRSQVVIQLTAGAMPLANKVTADLDSKFKRG